MTEGKEGLARRDFLKILGIGTVAVGGVGLVEYLADKKNDLSNPENFKEFVGKDVYPAYFKGRVGVREGATIHKYPTFDREQEKGIASTNVTRDTQIATVPRGNMFYVDRPLLVLNEAGEDEGGNFIKEVNTPDGGRIKINIAGSWAIFGLGKTEGISDEIRADIKHTQYKVACIEFRNLDFEPQIGPGTIEYRQEIDLGN